jgi:hypothetical protein
MSARRIKIKRSREARKQAAQARNSPITISDVLGHAGRVGDNTAADPDSEPIATEEELDAQWQDILNDLKSAKAARRPLSASDIDAAQATKDLSRNN